VLLLFITTLLLLDPWRLWWGGHGFGHHHQTPPVVTVLPPPAMTPDMWMKDHAPSLMTQDQLQSLYESLIKNYYVPQTGLFLSFPRTSDIRLVQQSATYDQAVIGILLLKLGDLKKAKGIVSFYKKAWDGAEDRSGPRQGIYGLSNFYNSYFEVEGIEKTMHVGPNAWIGLLASRYYRRTGDKEARDLALSIAHWMIIKVPHTDGAIAMGQIPWNSTPWDQIYSTENNLSTYAFLGDLLKATDLRTDERILISREHDQIGNWLIHKAYQPSTHSVLRGFHLHGLDRAGAIDSYTWFIDSLRPAHLAANSIPIERLLSKAETDFAVQVAGRPGIDAVDSLLADATYEDALHAQLKDMNFYRPAGDGHRLIWYEGTGQFIVALQDMAQHAVNSAFARPDGKERDALLQKASTWLDKAHLYTASMDKAAITAPGGITYPCATTGRFYLYGWPAPQPLEGHLADASAPLTWRMFAGMGFEPLTDTDLRPGAINTVKLYKWRSVRDPGTAILYGASEEMMVQAWKLYEKGDKDGAWRQAKATISLWEDNAHELQASKLKKVGTYLPFDNTVEGYQRIHDYWALNDVAACYFILGKIADEQKNYADASGYFSKILKDFYLAQMWDKRGWFWNPVNTIHDDYIEADEAHYGQLASLIPDIPALTVAQEEEYESRHVSANAASVTQPTTTTPVQ
jgi:hypothetical protein